MTINTITTTSTELSRTVAPALAYAPVEYQRDYHDNVNNVLRQYFNTLDNLIGQLSISPNYTVATLPTAASAGAGARAFVTDSSVSTFGTTVAGGGAINVPVYSDGTNWKVG